MKKLFYSPVLLVTFSCIFPSVHGGDCSSFGFGSSAEAACVVSERVEGQELRIAELRKQLADLWMREPADLAVVAGLQREEEDWLDFRETHCELESKMFGGAVTWGNCVFEMNKQRIQQLEDWKNP